MKLQKQRSMTSPRLSSGGEGNSRSTNTRGSLQTSKEYVARAQTFADARVHDTLRRFHANRAAATRGGAPPAPGLVDRTRWKLAKGGGRHHSIACYKKVASRKGFPGFKRHQQQHSNGSTEDDGESGGFRASMSSLRMTMSAKSTSSSPSATPSEQAELLAVGVVPGTLEDILHGTVNLTPEAMQIESAHAQCDLLDSRVLSALIAPSASAPFRSLTLKWTLRHHEVLSRHRDYVYLEATGVLRDPQDHGARVGYHLVHSVTLPSTPELAPEMQIVRGHLSYCYLFRQHSEQEVEIFFHGYMLPRGGVRDRLAFSLAAEAVLASPSTVECAMMKKLAFSLRTKQPSAIRPPSPPLCQSMGIRESMSGRKSTFSVFRASGITFDSSRSSVSFGGSASLNGSACRVCHRPVRAILASKVTHCELCEGPVCNRCRVSKKVFVFEGGVFHPQKMEFCSDCILSTNRMNAAWVASQELTRAVNRVRLSERISSSSEDFDPKTPASLGASLGASSWNSGRSRIDESRATMSLDGPMSSSEPHSVVWLPTDDLHARLTTVDMEIEEEDPSVEGNDDDEFYDDGSFIDTKAFVALEDDDDRFDEDDAIPMIDIPSEGEDDEIESEHTLALHAVDLVYVSATS